MWRCEGRQSWEFMEPIHWSSPFSTRWRSLTFLGSSRAQLSVHTDRLLWAPPRSPQVHSEPLQELLSFFCLLSRLFFLQEWKRPAPPSNLNPGSEVSLAVPRLPIGTCMPCPSKEPERQSGDYVAQGETRSYAPKCGLGRRKAGVARIGCGPSKSHPLQGPPCVLVAIHMPP